jgi:zinc protease
VSTWKQRVSALVGVALAVFAVPAAAVPPKAPKATAPKAAARAPVQLSIPLQRFTLDNGLRVVINVDHTSPTVAVVVTYDVGSRDEERGRSGFAHLFEHMMFQGSKNVPKGEHFKLVSSHGGSLNGTTNGDRTNYFEVLPASELALGLWLEADRMKALDVSQDNFENQRKVVQEEYRMRYSNAPYGLSHVKLSELIFQGYFPYEHPTIGSMADLDAAQIDWVRAFHAAHYGPNTAALTIAGDVDAAEATKLVHQYFDGVPRIQAAPFVEPPLPEQTSPRTAVHKDEIARTPGVLYGWPVPNARHADTPALEVAASLLGDGESSRLHLLLVRDKALARRASASLRDGRGPGSLRIDAALSEGASVAEVERLIEAEVKQLGERGPSDAELAKAQRLAESGLVLGLQANVARARVLGEMELFWGDAGLLEKELGRYLAVTKDDVKRVVQKYLVTTRRSLVETVPAEDKQAKDAAKKPAGRKP